MHGRRYFVKALDAGDERAAVPLRAFQALYNVEEAARDVSAAERLAMRRERSKPVYEDLRQWCVAHQPQEPPRSLLGAAIQYLLNHHVALTRFLDDGCVEVDTSALR